MHNPSIILHPHASSKRGFNMAAKSKKSAAAEKSVAIREMKQQQHHNIQHQQYQQHSPPRTHIIKDDETLLIDPAIVAAENPDVSSPVFLMLRMISKARPLKLYFALLAIHTLLDTLIPATRIIPPPAICPVGARPEALSTRGIPLPIRYPLSLAYLAISCLQQLLPFFIHWYSSSTERHKLAPPLFRHPSYLDPSIKP
jgi:hypothetical protein